MKKKRFGVIGIALAILFLLGAAPSVLAAGLPSVAIPVKVEVEGAAPSVPEEFVVQMEAEDPSYPMPEGSVDGIFEMVISGNSFMSFPSMSYTEPGIYTYTIEQIAGLNPLCAYDPSVYHLKVSVTNAQDGSGLTAMVALRSEDADEKLAEAMFTNRYGTSPVPRDSNPPKTGDESNILLYGYLALVSIAGLVVSVVIQKRGKTALKLILGALAQEGYGVILALFARKLDYAMEQRLVMLITGRCFVWAAMRMHTSIQGKEKT